MTYKKIWIFGGTASGKTTLAGKISRILKIPHYQTDDFVYKKKWCQKFTKEEKENNLKKVAKKTKWLIEGAHVGEWILPGIKDAEIIIFMKTNRLVMLKRFSKRKDNNKKTMKGMVNILYWIIFFQSKYYTKWKEKSKKFIILKNNKQINEFLKTLK